MNNLCQPARSDQRLETRSRSITLRAHRAAARPAARTLRPGAQRGRLLPLALEGGDLAQHPPEGARARARDVAAGAARAKRCGARSGRGRRACVCVCGTRRGMGQPCLGGGATAPKLSEARSRGARLVDGGGRRGGRRGGRSCGRRSGQCGGGALEREVGDGHEARAASMAHEEPALVAAAASEQLDHVAHLRHERWEGAAARVGSNRGHGW